MYIYEASRVLRPFQVAAHPIETFGDTREHD
jgi:hypothetical protein